MSILRRSSLLDEHLNFSRTSLTMKGWFIKNNIQRSIFCWILNKSYIERYKFSLRRSFSWNREALHPPFFFIPCGICLLLIYMKLSALLHLSVRELIGVTPFYFMLTMFWAMFQLALLRKFLNNEPEYMSKYRDMWMQDEGNFINYNVYLVTRTPDNSNFCYLFVLESSLIFSYKKTLINSNLR